MTFELICLLATVLPADQPTLDPAGALPAAAAAAAGAPRADVQRLDAILEAAWQAAAIQPATRCSDHEFLRRVSLDLIGRIPTLEEVRQFERNPDRTAKIDELLGSDEFPRFWSELWTVLLIGYGEENGVNREALRTWLEQAFRDGRPYNEVAAQLIAATGQPAFDGPVNYLLGHPEEPAISVSRLFLGVRLDCARCHDHPFDRWTKEDLDLMSRFFAGVERQEEAGAVRLVNSLGNFGAAEEDKPRFLTGARPRTGQWRDELALFVTRSRPFARNFANRLWYQLLGRGIVHPVDDFNQENRPAVPPLMEYLTEEVRANGFDMRATLRLICQSRAYQLSSALVQRDARHEALFAARSLKPLTAEQLHDSLAAALQQQPTRESRREFVREFVGDALNHDAGEFWQYRETVQALMTRLARDLPLPSEDTDQLYRRILSRPPTPRERQVCQGRPPQDVAFALFHGNEFFFNH